VGWLKNSLLLPNRAPRVKEIPKEMWHDYFKLMIREALPEKIWNMHCTQSQKDGQNYKNAGVRREILPKCPSRRANQSLDWRLGYTGFLNMFINGSFSFKMLQNHNNALGNARCNVMGYKAIAFHRLGQKYHN